MGITDRPFSGAGRVPGFNFGWKYLLLHCWMLEVLNRSIVHSTTTRVPGFTFGWKYLLLHCWMLEVLNRSIVHSTTTRLLLCHVCWYLSGRHGKLSWTAHWERRRRRRITEVAQALFLHCWILENFFWTHSALKIQRYIWYLIKKTVLEIGLHLGFTLQPRQRKQIFV